MLGRRKTWGEKADLGVPIGCVRIAISPLHRKNTNFVLCSQEEMS